MSDDTDDPEDSDHIKTASKSTRLAIIGLSLGAYHSVLGVDEWLRSRGRIVRSFVSGSIFVVIMWILNKIGSIVFTTFWGQAAYMSGLELRLLPIPVSLAIYILAISFFLFGCSLDSSIRRQQSELEETKSELEDVKSKIEDIKENSEVIQEESESNE